MIILFSSRFSTKWSKTATVFFLDRHAHFSLKTENAVSETRTESGQMSATSKTLGSYPRHQLSASDNRGPLINPF